MERHHGFFPLAVAPIRAQWVNGHIGITPMRVLNEIIRECVQAITNAILKWHI